MALSRTAAIMFVLLAAVAASAAAQNKGQTVRRHRVVENAAVAQAEAAMDRKEYASAEQILRRAVEEQPNDYRTWFDLGFVYTATGKKTEAVDAYRHSVAANPKIFESNLNLGLMLAQANDPEAEKYLRAATELKPSSNAQEGLARAWVSLGHVLATRDAKGAEDAYRRATRLQPGNVEARVGAAAAAAETADYKSAEEEYKAAILLDPRSADALAGLVNVYFKTARAEEAEPVLRKYLELDPNNGAAHVQLGRVLTSLHRRAEALEELEKGLQLSPEDTTAQRQLAFLLLEDKQYDKAEPVFRALLTKNPNDAGLHHGLGESLLQQRKFPAAQQEFLTAIRLKNDFGDAYASLAMAASENKDYALTIKALDARAKFLPEIAGTYFLRATAYDHLRDFQQAAANYRQFLAMADGKYPDQEWQARHRLIAIEPKK